MNTQKQTGLDLDLHLWGIVEGLFSPDPNIRENSLESLKEIDGLNRSPLIASLLVSRISEPDLEIRFRNIQLLGDLVDFDSANQHFTDEALVFAKFALDQLDRIQLLGIMEVSESYLTAEKAIKNILKLSSYAGVGLSGIVNDRKIPVSLRQQAVYFCGEVGYLTAKPTLQNLVLRVEKSRSRSGGGSERKKSRDEEFLYPYAISALDKLKT